MASRALALEPPGTFPAPRFDAHPIVDGAGILSRITHPRRPAPEKIDLGLRAGVCINFTPDGRNPQPYALLEIADKIRKIQSLPSDWDSYGANPLSDSAVLPAIDLAIFSILRCSSPDVLPLNDGGLGLRWSSGQRELEIDVHPDRTFSAYFEDQESGEDVEIDQSVDAQEVLSLIRRFLVG